MGPGMDWLAIYLDEDLGEASHGADPLRGDLTSDALFAPDQQGSARVVARQPCILAGLDAAMDIFQRLGATGATVAKDGDELQPGDIIMRITGPVRAMLAAERTALNIVGRMSGIATATRRMAGVLEDAGSLARVAGTRKTTPGFRHYEKEAIRIGGGDPHRMGLFDAMMVKDNHRAAAGDLQAAIARLRAAHPDKLLEVEVESKEDARVAAEAGVDWVLIDNQPPDVAEAWAEVVRVMAPATKVEASGGIREEDLVAYGWADRISLGALTHQAVSVDVGMDWG